MAPILKAIYVDLNYMLAGVRIIFTIICILALTFTIFVSNTYVPIVTVLSFCFVVFIINDLYNNAINFRLRFLLPFTKTDNFLITIIKPSIFMVIYLFVVFSPYIIAVFASDFPEDLINTGGMSGDIQRHPGFYNYFYLAPIIVYTVYCLREFTLLIIIVLSIVFGSGKVDYKPLLFIFGNLPACTILSCFFVYLLHKSMMKDNDLIDYDDSDDDEDEGDYE